MDGILIVDKQQGMTSHDVVDLLRKRFGLKKVGHAGTLDPMATGVLVMLIGSYTKRSNTFLCEEKEYKAQMTLGAVSDTLDAWGILTPSGLVPLFSREELESAFRRFTGEIEQYPPMYSSVKVKGRKLYEFARRGIKVEVAPRKIFIKNIEIGEVSLPAISFKVICSKGTYVRQLCSDIGRVLGCGAYLSGLRRTRSGAFTLEGAVSVDELGRLGGDELAKRLVVV